MLVAGTMSALAVGLTYLILFVAHAIYKQLHHPSHIVPDIDYQTGSLLGFDSQGTLKIESVIHPH